MAYKTTIAKACTTRDQALTELWAQMAAMGWTLVDGSCTPVTVAYTAVDVSANTFTSVGHTFANGMPVQLKTTGSAPSGLAVLTQYYIVNVSGNTFKLATTYNGSAIDITAQGSGNHTITESYRVYSSNGENGDKAPEVIQLRFWASATTIVPYMAYKWDTATHAAVATNPSAYAGDSLTTNETGFYLWIYGNKNILRIVTKIASTYYQTMFGFYTPFLNFTTTLTSGATAGNGATLTVASTVGFEVGYTYQIISTVGEGRDPLVIASIVNPTSMTVTNLPRNYSSGSIIGLDPSTFFMSNATNYWVASPFNAVGLTSVANWSSGAIITFIPITNLDPENSLNKYVLQPLGFSTEQDGIGSANLSMGGYIDEYILNAPTVGLTSEDTFAAGTKRDSGTSSGTNNSSTVMYDTAKTWTTNAFAGKVIVVSFGTGVGQIKKIASNTETTLTLATGYIFETVPDATSQYIICDEGYRYFLSASAGYACREGV